MQDLLIEFAKEHLVALAYATLWYVLAGLIAALFARKTRIDAWCEANPALALALNFLRATGFDFWKILAALQTLASGKSKLPPVGPAITMLFAIGASVTQVGCAGSFEEARLARHPKTLTASASLSDRCVKLSDRIRWEGAAEVGGLALTGATGLSAIPLDGKTERIAIVSATTGLVAGTAILHFLTEADRASFVTECTQ